MYRQTDLAKPMRWVAGRLPEGGYASAVPKGTYALLNNKKYGQDGSWVVINSENDV